MCTNGVAPVRHDELANVVCRQLGKDLPGRVVGDAFYGAGAAASPVWSDGITCDGTETSLEQCARGAWKAAKKCGHSQDLSIQCGGDPGKQSAPLAAGALETACSAVHGSCIVLTMAALWPACSGGAPRWRPQPQLGPPGD